MEKKIVSFFCVTYDHETSTWNLDDDVIEGYLNGCMLDVNNINAEYFYPHTEEEKKMDDNAFSILQEKLNL